MLHILFIFNDLFTTGGFMSAWIYTIFSMQRDTGLKLQTQSKAFLHVSNRPVNPEAVWLESHRHGEHDLLPIVLCFDFCWWNVADQLPQSVVVEAVNPCQRYRFNGFVISP